VCRREEFMQWTESLGDNQTPSWLGLPNSAETVLLTSLGMLSLSSCSLCQLQQQVSYCELLFHW